MRLGSWAGRSIAGTTLLLAACASPPESPPPSSSFTGGPAVLHDPPPSVPVESAELVGQITGGQAWTDTRRWGVHGTDLGHTFWHGDDLYMVFGDTFGEGGLGGDDWRSNAIARVELPHRPSDGVRLADMVSGSDGTARELLSSLKIDGIEKTVIPTHGISVNGRMYLHYMSVRGWYGGTGQWDVRHAGFAYSDDDGETWTTPRDAVYPEGSGFEQVAMVREGPHVYIFGIPEGRAGGARLSRVAAGSLLDLDAHEYWDGEGWSPSLEAAATVVPPWVGELSVAWNDAHQQWMMMYLNLEREAVVLRTAPELTGPWGREEVVFTSGEHPGLYAPYILPLPELSDEIYFTMSLWGPYNVFLARVDLGRPIPVADAAGDP